MKPPGPIRTTLQEWLQNPSVSRGYFGKYSEFWVCTMLCGASLYQVSITRVMSACLQLKTARRLQYQNQGLQRKYVARHCSLLRKKEQITFVECLLQSLSETWFCHHRTRRLECVKLKSFLLFCMVMKLGLKTHPVTDNRENCKMTSFQYLCLLKIPCGWSNQV